MPRTLSLLFPEGKTEFWLTEQAFAVGDTLIRNARVWVVTSLGNFNREGKAMAITLRLDDEAQSGSAVRQTV